MQALKHGGRGRRRPRHHRLGPLHPVYRRLRQLLMPHDSIRHRLLVRALPVSVRVLVAIVLILAQELHSDVATGLVRGRRCRRRPRLLEVIMMFRAVGDVEEGEDHLPEDRLEFGILVEVDADVAGGVEYEEPVADDGQVLEPDGVGALLLGHVGLLVVVLAVKDLRVVGVVGEVVVPVEVKVGAVGHVVVGVEDVVLGPGHGAVLLPVTATPRDKPVDLETVEDELDAVADEEDENDGHEHGRHGDVPLLPARHPGPPLVGLLDGADHEDVEDDHDEDGADAHEDEVGEQDVVLDVVVVVAEGRGDHCELGLVLVVSGVRVGVVDLLGL